MTDEAQKIVAVLSAIGAIDLKSHRVWQTVRQRNAGRWAALQDGVLYTVKEDVTFSGDSFTAQAGFGYDWECECHGQSVPDFEEVFVIGRFVDGRPVIEQIVQKYPSEP